MTEELAEPGGKVRLFVDAPLGDGMRIEPSPQQAHYLMHVMRAKANDRVSLFNGGDGEWLARIADVTKRNCALLCERQTEPQRETPDVWLCFAPIKKIPADYVVQKATELGVRALQPVFTRRTIVTRTNRDRMLANAVEAAEQSGRVSVPEVRESVALENLLRDWPRERRLYFCDEGGNARPIAEAMRDAAPRPCAILTGPEGGFDAREREAIRAHASVTPLTLGQRILRADTAALAALAVWQAVAGDWPRS